jgi:uncharacterized protein
MVRRTWMAPLAVWLLATAAACDPRDRSAPEVDPPVSFDTATVVIETAADQVTITVELADSQQQRAYGLMERPSLPANRGMLFTYPGQQDADSGFWMYRTLIPLDIAFLDETGRIVAIEQMQPCEAANPRLCPIYSPGVPYVAALEVNRGFFGQHGIQVGDRVRRADMEATAGG